MIPKASLSGFQALLRGEVKPHIPVKTIATLAAIAAIIGSGIYGCSSGGSTASPSGGILNPTSGLNSVPTISTLFPSCAPAGEQLVDSVDNLQVIGSNFVAGSVVRWNGIDQPTTLDSNSRGGILTAQISANDIATAGTAAVTVFNPPPGGGSSNSLTFTTTIGAGSPVSIAVDSAGKFAYVATAGCDGVGYVSEYTINPTTGALTSIGSAAATVNNAQSVTVDPFGKFVYVANSADDFSSDGGVAMYSINPTTGALASIGVITGNCPGLCVPESVAIDPSGKFAYVPNGDGLVPYSVAIYTINPTTGALTSIGTVAVGGFAALVAADPTGRFAYVATWSASPGSAGNVSMFTINATTGALTSTGTITAGITPLSIAMDPTGKFAYVANSGSNDVSMYTINATSGALTSLGPIVAGTSPSSVAVDPTGKFAYVANSGSNNVSMYNINATTGVLTSTGTIAAGSSPTSIAVHPSGTFAYVTNSGSNSVSMYSIDATSGVLTLVGTIGT